MKALEIYINGQQRCIAGIGELGVITAIIHWVKREREVLTKRKDLEDEELAIRVGGSFTAPDGVTESLEWIGETLAIGDEITIKIIESDQVSEPAKRQRIDYRRTAKDERRYYERLKREYGE